jgi:hypothetical protein
MMSPKALGDIIRLDKLQGELPEDVTRIWNTYHGDLCKDAVGEDAL